MFDRVQTDHAEGNPSHAKNSAQKAVPGIFLGWYIAPGAEWTGDYLVVDLKAVVADIDGAYVNVQRVKEAMLNAKQLTFPLTQGYDDSRRNCWFATWTPIYHNRFV